MAEQALGVGHILPLEVVDKCIGRRMWIIMKSEKEFYGVLQGFDEYMNLVMHDCKEYEYKGHGSERVLINKMD